MRGGPLLGVVGGVAGVYADDAEADDARLAALLLGDELRMGTKRPYRKIEVWG